MFRVLLVCGLTVLPWFLPATVFAGEVTRIEVGVLADGAKFIGDLTGGAHITIKDENTGEVLAEGRTRGGTGSTERIMGASGLYADITSDRDAVFVAELAIDSPRRVVVVARGPMDYAQAMQTAQKSLWLVPGRALAGANRVILTLSGYIIEPVEIAINQMGSGRLKVDLQMLCGCRIVPGGTWDADRIHKQATLTGPTGIVQTVELEYSGEGITYVANFGGQVKHPRSVRIDLVDMDNDNTASLTIPITR